jgi:hypothetical protein
MTENEIIPITDVPETAKEKFERERLTRRQALKKFGMTSAMAAFALFSVDDLAHMVGKAIEQKAGDSQVATQVAKEFQSAGIALADGPSGSSCQHCANQLHLDNCYCVDTYSGGGSSPNPTMFQHCNNQTTYNYNTCCNIWCPGGMPVNPNNGPGCPPASSQQPPQGCGC